MNIDNQPPNHVEASSVCENCRAGEEGEIMNKETLPLPVAMRVEEISERDFEILCEAAKSTPSVVARLKRQPSRIPQLESGVTAV